MVEKKDEDATRAKFLEALEKKKKTSGSGSSVGPNTGSKVGGAAGGSAPKRFQRKSGSA
jgi:hypothetical protein